MTMSNYIRLAFKEDASRPSPAQILSTKNCCHLEAICEDFLDQWLDDGDYLVAPGGSATSPFAKRVIENARVHAAANA
jgi:hypothetical protein